MRMLSITAASLLALTLAACDQSQQQSSAPASSPNAAPAAATASTGVYTTTGQVTAVAPDSVTISHQPVPALNWPAMTMTFKAPDQVMTTGLQNGAAVEFSFRQEGNDYVLTDMKKR